MLLNWSPATQINTRHVGSIRVLSQRVCKNSYPSSTTFCLGALSVLSHVERLQLPSADFLSIYNCFWLAGYKAQTVNLVLTGKRNFVYPEVCSAFPQHKLSLRKQNFLCTSLHENRASCALPCTKTPLATSLLTLHFHRPLMVTLWLDTSGSLA